MKEIAKQLGIDTDLIARDLEFHHGVGVGYLFHIERYLEQQRREKLAFAATALRRAGSHALLLDDGKLALEMFAKSASCYAQLLHPYASMMWSLARNLQFATSFSDSRLNEFVVTEGRYPSERYDQLAYPLLVESVADTEAEHGSAPESRSRRMRQVAIELSAFSTTPVGMMGIPMESYLNLARSIEMGATPQAVQYSLLPFLNAYEVAVVTARSKAYHWRRLLMPFHPVEPDILSVLCVADAWLKRHKEDLAGFIRERTESRFASLLLPDALERLEG